MKKHISSFLAGVATTVLLAALCTGALAASGKITYNASNIALDGTVKIAAGTEVTAQNGQKVPSSILYTDAAGGKTNYLPIRAVSELLEVEIGYDSAAKTVQLKSRRETIEEVKARLAGSAVKGTAAKGEVSKEDLAEGLVDGKFPVTAGGMTYGSIVQAEITGEFPDLVLVSATNGKSGWVKLEDFEPIYAMKKAGVSQEELNAYIDSIIGVNEVRTVPVYDLEMRVIGEFKCGYSER